MAPPLARVPGLRRIAQLAGPVRRDVALFDSWAGQFSDSPRAIAEELRRREPGIRQVWVLADALRNRVPDWVEPVAPGSRAHLAHLGRAGLLVANNTVPGFHAKRRGQFFLQTWHGTPLKRIGFDIEAPSFGRPDQYRRTLAHNSRRWDLLIAPNAFSSPIFRSAFRYHGRILETGYPRNDMLVGAAATETRDRVRSQLGIEAAQTAVLYAPTFRDGRPFAGRERLSPVTRLLGDDHLLMLRAHSIDASASGAQQQDGILDVSGHPEVGELYLAADMLVTDYSSVMFDFAVTGKPMAFYTYDLEEYRDRLRGFYFDFEREAPGPLVTDADALGRAILEPAGDAAAYERFRERFCALEDGRASERVVEALLARAG